MRINKQKINKQKIAIILILSLIMGSGLALGITAFNNNDRPDSAKTDTTRAENSIDYDDATDKQKEAGIKAKESFIDRYDSGIQSPQDSQPNLSDVVVTITSVSQQDDMLQVRAIIESVTEGMCRINLSRDGSRPISYSADTQNMGSYSVCQGFDVPLEDLEKGSWDIRIEFENSTSKGSAEKRVEVV